MIQCTNVLRVFASEQKPCMLESIPFAKKHVLRYET